MCYPTDTKPVQADKPVVPSFEHVQYKMASADYKDLEGFIAELRDALGTFDITVADDPSLDGTDMVGVIISRSDIITEDLAKTLKADLPEQFRGLRVREITSKLRTQPVFSKGDEVIDLLSDSNEESVIVRREWVENCWLYIIRHKKDTDESYNIRNRFEHEIE